MEQIQTALTKNPFYILGHSEDELDRLIHQARFFGDLTEHMLRLAGLERGMRVLDVGCGTGDVSFLAARLVGPQGTIIGVDKSSEAISVASQRSEAAGLTNVQFLTQDLSELALDDPIDALIGRLVLMYFGDPAVLLRRLAAFLKPGGIVAFQEMDMNAATSEPPCEVFEAAVQHINQTFRRAGIDVYTSLKLARIFQEAGLPAPQMIQSARVESGPDSPFYSVVTQLTRTLLPLMERTGVATAGEVDVETLTARMRDEAVARQATLVAPPFIGAWTRKNLA